MAAMISQTRAAKHQTQNTNKHWLAMATMIVQMQAHATQQKQTYFGNGRNDIVTHCNTQAQTHKQIPFGNGRNDIAGPSTQTNIARQWPQ
jgi:hypothetical protein